MKAIYDKIWDGLSKKPSVFQALLCAFFITAVFSLRWANCLPFSGNMPFLYDGDNIEIYSRYLIFAQESFHFPVGLIKNLSFPFETANIARGPIDLLALLFKLLSKAYQPLAEFYYLPSAELAAVFLTALLTYLLLKSLRVPSFWLKFLGTVLVTLSFPLLYRSSNYHTLSYQVMYFPVYLALAYFYIRMNQKFYWRFFIGTVLLFPIAALIDYYLLFAVCFLLAVCAGLSGLEALRNWTQDNRNRMIRLALSFILGVLLSCGVLFAMGNENNLRLPSTRSVLAGRYDHGWGYGGGFGGGFHVADVFTFFVPPEDNESLPNWQRVGPSAYLTKMGFPLTTAGLQSGQYEGFNYLGTTTIGILFFLSALGMSSFSKNNRLYFERLKMKLASKKMMDDDLFSPAAALGIAAFFLFTISWGYIIHAGGIRFNNIVTPSLILAEIWPRFMFARSLGKLAAPLALYITIGGISWLGHYFYVYVQGFGRLRKVVFTFLMVSLIFMHVSEVKGYLTPPERVSHGNDIANVLSAEDGIFVKKLLEDKKALIVVPQLRSNLDWSKICYALAFYSQKPISGATIGIAVPAEYNSRFVSDVNNILKGDVREVIGRYGDVAIAAREPVAKEILSKSNIPLKDHKLNSQDVVILTVNR